MLVERLEKVLKVVPYYCQACAELKSLCMSNYQPFMVCLPQYSVSRGFFHEWAALGEMQGSPEMNRCVFGGCSSLSLHFPERVMAEG